MSLLCPWNVATQGLVDSFMSHSSYQAGLPSLTRHQKHWQRTGHHWSSQYPRFSKYVPQELQCIQQCWNSKPAKCCRWIRSRYAVLQCLGMQHISHFPYALQIDGGQSWAQLGMNSPAKALFRINYLS
jgi:hypothetical protein